MFACAAPTNAEDAAKGFRIIEGDLSATRSISSLRFFDRGRVTRSTFGVYGRLEFDMSTFTPAPTPRLQPSLGGLAAALGLVLATLPSVAEARPTVIGAGAETDANGMIQSWAEDFLFDTGASQTIMSRNCAMQMGLLTDADGDGTPDLSDGDQGFNGGAFDTWCFEDVAIAAISSAGENCVTSTTIYVGKTADFPGGASILGGPWQEAVDACYRAKGQRTSWPWEQPPAEAPRKAMVPGTDGQSGQQRALVSDVEFTGPGGTQTLDMFIMTGSDRSFLPASFAFSLAEPTGEIDLEQDDPQLLGSLAVASANTTGQTVFPLVTLDAFDLGIGPAGSSIEVLVSDDASGDFGIIGNDMLGGTIDSDEILYAVAEGEAGTLFFTTVDCDGNGIGDDDEIEDDPALDVDDDQILDSCQSARGAACMPDGSCLEVPEDFADFTGAIYVGDGISCAETDCQNLPGGDTGSDETGGDETGADEGDTGTDPTADGDGSGTGAATGSGGETAAADDGDDGGGCGCNQSAPTGTGWLMLLALIGLRPRRRRVA